MSEAVFATPPNTPWNRNDRRALILSAAVPLLAAVLVNGVLFATGIAGSDPAYEAVAFNPPSWLVALVWLAIYPMWGAARWYAYQTGLAGRRASFWVVVLMLWGLLYPFVTAGPSVLVSALANLASLALAIVTAAQLRPVSKRAFALVAISVLWIGFATVLGFAALTNA